MDIMFKVSWIFYDAVDARIQKDYVCTLFQIMYVVSEAPADKALPPPPRSRASAERRTVWQYCRKFTVNNYTTLSQITITLDEYWVQRKRKNKDIRAWR